MSEQSTDGTEQKPIAQKVSDGELLRAVAEVDEPVAKTAEVSDQVPVQKQTVKGRLEALEVDGYLNSKQVGRGFVWWLESDRSDLNVATNKTEEMERRLSLLEDRVADLEGGSGWLFR